MVSIPTIERVPRPRSFGLDLRLDNLLWQTAPTPEQPVDFAPPPLRDETAHSLLENPEDFTAFEAERPFSRRRFSGGEGLDVAHRRDGTIADYSRYWASRRVKVQPSTPGDPEVLELLSGSREAATYPTATSISAVAVDSTLFVARADSESIDVYPDIFNPSPIITSEDPSPAASSVTDLTRIGRQLFAGVEADGVWRRSRLGVWSQWSTENVSRLWPAKGRLVARGVDTRELYEVGETAAVLLATLPSGTEWTDVTDGGTHVLASATDGYVYSFGEQDGSLVLVAQSEVEGEQPMSLGATQGVVFIGTREANTQGGWIGRLWRSELAQGGTLTGSQLVRTWGGPDDPLDWTPSDIAAGRSDAYIWVRDRLWRFLVPTGGIASHIEFDVTGPAQIAVVAGRAVVAVTDEGGGGSAVWAEDDTAESDGWLISPAVDFFDDRPKHWKGLRLFHAPLPAGTRVALYYSAERAAMSDPDHPSWQLATSRNGPTLAVDSEIPLSNESSRWLILKVEMSSGGGGASPTVYGFALRAYPSNEQLVATIPVNVSGWVDTPRRRRTYSPALAELRWSTLLSYRGQEVEVEHYPTGIHMRGVVQAVSSPILVADRHGHLGTMVSTLQVRGDRVLPTQSVVVTGNTFGVPVFGGAVYGGAA